MNSPANIIQFSRTAFKSRARRVKLSNKKKNCIPDNFASFTFRFSPISDTRDAFTAFYNSPWGESSPRQFRDQKRNASELTHISYINSIVFGKCRTCFENQIIRGSQNDQMLNFLELMGHNSAGVLVDDRGGGGTDRDSHRCSALIVEYIRSSVNHKDSTICDAFVQRTILRNISRYRSPNLSLRREGVRRP